MVSADAELTRPWADNPAANAAGRAVWESTMLGKKPRVFNSYAGLVAGLGGGDFGDFGREQLSQPGTFFSNMAASPFTMQMMALNWGYMTYGLAQTLIDQPVDDAFKGGVIIKIPEFDAEDIKLLQREIRRNRDIMNFKQASKWARLFGGAGLIAANDDDPSMPLDIANIREGEPLSFIACDRWELTIPGISQSGRAIPAPYQYYSERLDWSRVMRFKGREAPSRIRCMLQGWGMSELEHCMRSLQTFLKLQTVVYDLIDEAKIDVYFLENLNELLSSAKGTQAAILRIQIANWIKNYKNAVVLDGGVGGVGGDKYEQKVQAFSGLSDLFEQARINFAGDVRFPVAKLFGLSSTGFASGEDALENYAALVDSDVREPSMPNLHDMLSMRMMATFGVVPEFEAEFLPMRMANPVEEETIKTSKQARALALRQADQITGAECDEILHQEGLLVIETEVGQGLREPVPVGTEQPDDDVEDNDKPEKKSSKNGIADEARQKYEWLQRQSRRGSFKAWAKAQSHAERAA